MGFFLWFAASALAATLHVDDSAAGGDGSIASPFSDLQAAIDAAADGDDILVAEGTYAPIGVYLKEVHLFGGYDAGFTTSSPSTPSVIEGNEAAPVVTLFEVGDSVLDGFTLRGGLQGVSIDADYLSTTNRPEIRNNLIEQNGSPEVYGGGIYADHCEGRFIGNTIRGNIGLRGAAIATLCSTVLIEDNLVENNIAHGDHGGGIYLYGTDLVLRRNLIRGNEVGVIVGYGWGGGVTIFGEGAVATFEDNVFTGNRAMSVGSGAFIDDGAVATFTRDLFYANACGVYGAGLYVNGYYTNVASYATLVNVTMANHDCPGTPGSAVFVEDQSHVDILNSIFWGNGGDDFEAISNSTVTATYTLSEEPIDGTGNLSADPLFADPASGDFHVRSTQGRYDPATGDFVQDDVDSPTIDAGDPASAFDREPGPNGLRINLGHTGNTAEASMGGPGGTSPTDDPTTDDPPTDEGTTEDTGSPADPSKDGDKGPGGGCGCDTGHRSPLASLLPLAWLSLAFARRRSARLATPRA